MRLLLKGGATKRLVILTRTQVDWLEQEANRLTRAGRAQTPPAPAVSVSTLVRDAVRLYMRVHGKLVEYEGEREAR